MKDLKNYHTQWKGKIAERKTYFKILFSITGCMLTVVLLLSAIMYRSARDMLTEQSIQLSTQSFAQIQSVVDTMQSTAGAVATQALLEDSCGQILLALDAQSADAKAVYEAVRQLTLYQNIHDSIDSIYLYNAAADLMVTSETKSLYMRVDDFYDAALVERLRNYPQYKERAMFKRPVAQRPETNAVPPSDVYTYIVPNLYEGEKLKSAVVVNISADWLARELVKTQPLENNMIVVLDTAEPQPLIELNGLGEAITRTAFRPAVEKMMANGESYTEYTYDGEKYFLSYLYSQKLGWHFIRATKWNVVFGVLEQLRKGAVLLLSCIVLLCLVLSLVGAGSLYKLYHVVEGNYNRLARNRRTQTDRMRENFLGDYLSGAKLFTPKQLQARLEEHELSLASAPVHTMALLRIEQYEALKEQYSEAGMHNVKYGIRNIFEELCQPYFNVIGLLGRENCLLFIFSPRDKAVSMQEVKRAFAHFCQRVQVFVKSSYNLVGIEETVSPAGLPALYQTLVEVVRETFFYPSNTYVAYADIQENHTSPIDAHALNHRILPALLSGNTEETMRQYESFSQAMVGCNYADYSNVLIWLGFSIARTLGEAQSAQQESERSYFGDFLMRIMACEKKQEADALFEETFAEVQRALEQANAKTGVQGKLEEIQRYIEERYADGNLSLESVADSFDISPSYLGKIFRKASSVSLAEYINQVRLEHVVRQMAATNRSVKDIAADCGFAGANYFYTYFKKKYGLTPQAYREKMKNDV